MYDKWNRYTHVCQTCDALVEYTSKRVVNEITCECGGMCIWVSQEPATIVKEEKKEDIEMNTTTTFLETKVAELEEIISRQNSALTTHQNCDYWKSENGRVQSQIIDLINDAYDNGTDEEEILTALCQIIDYNPTKEVQFTATISFTGRIDVPRHEQDDFNLEDVLSEAYVDINHGDVVIDSYELYDANEC